MKLLELVKIEIEIRFQFFTDSNTGSIFSLSNSRRTLKSGSYFCRCGSLNGMPHSIHLKKFSLFLRPQAAFYCSSMNSFAISNSNLFKAKGRAKGKYNLEDDVVVEEMNYLHTPVCINSINSY